jgi:hypothetical protein
MTGKRQPVAVDETTLQNSFSSLMEEDAVHGFANPGYLLGWLGFFICASITGFRIIPVT